MQLSSEYKADGFLVSSVEPLQAFCFFYHRNNVVGLLVDDTLEKRLVILTYMVSFLC